MKGKFYSYIFITGLQCNGTLLFRKVGSRAKYLDHGLVYRFSPLEPYEEEKISQNGMDQDAVLSMQLTFYLEVIQSISNRYAHIIHVIVRWATKVWFNLQFDKIFSVQ